MSTPTNPYSRDNFSDDNDNILDPLPVKDEAAANEPESQDSVPEAASDPESSAESTQAWMPAFNDEDELEHQAHHEDTVVSTSETRSDSDYETDSESTTFAPSFDEDEPKAEAETVEAVSRSESNTDSDETVVAEHLNKDHEPTVVTSDEADATISGRSTSAYPQRTSIFDRPTEAQPAVPLSTDSAPATEVAPATPANTPAPATASQPKARPEWREHSAVNRTIPIPEEPGGRAWSHVGVFFATLILAPFSWYLISDAGIRLAQLSDSQWVTHELSWMSILELFGAMLCVGVLWFLFAASSFGASFFGFIIMAAGLVPVFAPKLVQDLLASEPVTQFGNYNDFTGNVVHHFGADLATGRVAIFGFLILMTGIVSHAARRRGAERGHTLGRRDVLLSHK